MRTNRIAFRAFTVIELLVVIAVVALLAYLAVPVISGSRMAAKRTQCLSNMKQIGTALLTYAADHGGRLPVTSHTTGNRRRKVNDEWVSTIEDSWIYTIAKYLGNVDRVRVCPADEEARKQSILTNRASSYILNDLVFDDELHQRLQLLRAPATTPIVFISNRPVGQSWDHTHSGAWSSWAAFCEDVAADRHRSGRRDPGFLNGSANYLYADGHVKNLTAGEMKRVVESGAAPWNP